jgi:hypothetical protein
MSYGGVRMKEKVLNSTKIRDEFSRVRSEVLISRRKIKNKDYVFLKLAEFELFIPSRYLTFVFNVIQAQFIICSELLKSYDMSLDYAQLISALMTQEFKSKRKRLIGYEA